MTIKTKHMDWTLLLFPLAAVAVLFAVRKGWVHRLMPRFSETGWDKMGHLFLYFTLTTLAALFFTRAGLSLRFLFFPMCVVAILHECRHYFLPDRSFEFMDLAANFSGILMAWFFCRMIGL
ncbi:MAG: hypothetical protein D6714_16970 [Bacteroidetes bacterium]|nr:MAG: hypothetical protein D6714_16970 [Bacteroidota bacterium]